MAMSDFQQQIQDMVERLQRLREEPLAPSVPPPAAYLLLPAPSSALPPLSWQPGREEARSQRLRNDMDFKNSPDRYLERHAGATSSTDSPFVVRPDHAGRSSGLTDDELVRLRSEEAMASMANIPWQSRGPVDDPDVQYWRGQRWRRGEQGGQQRFGNRGGRHKEFYAAMAKKGYLEPTPGKRRRL